MDNLYVSLRNINQTRLWLRLLIVLNLAVSIACFAFGCFSAGMANLIAIAFHYYGISKMNEMENQIIQLYENHPDMDEG